MKIFDVEQGTEEWLALRLGIPTASNFHQIITPGGDLSDSSRKYMARLLAERLLNESMEAPLDKLEHIERGRLDESDAVHAFEFENDCETVRLGFITTDDGRWGASLDRAFIGGILEVKCPSPQVHLQYYMDGFGKAYKVQVQGQLLVATKDGLDIDEAARWSFNRRLPPVLTRTPRDKAFIAKMRSHLDRFSDELDEHERTLRAAGYFETRAQVVSAIDQAYGLDGSLADYTITGPGELPDLRIAG